MDINNLKNYFPKGFEGIEAKNILEVPIFHSHIDVTLEERINLLDNFEDLKRIRFHYDLGDNNSVDFHVVNLRDEKDSKLDGKVRLIYTMKELKIAEPRVSVGRLTNNFK